VFTGSVNLIQGLRSDENVVAAVQLSPELRTQVDAVIGRLVPYVP
jgi:hypothetical protein